MMRNKPRTMVAAAMVALVGCGEGNSGPCADASTCLAVSLTGSGTVSIVASAMYGAGDVRVGTDLKGSATLPVMFQIRQPDSRIPSKLTLAVTKQETGKRTDFPLPPFNWAGGGPRSVELSVP